MLELLQDKCYVIQVQLLVSDSDVESYKQIKSDLDVLRQSVEKSELWVYKSRSVDESTKKIAKEDDDEGGGDVKSTPNLAQTGKQNSAVDLDVGPPLHSDQAEEYKKIQQVMSDFNM